MSAREEEILRSICEGYKNKEIAEALGIDQGTVKNHVTRILVKMGAKNRTHAVAMKVKRETGAEILAKLQEISEEIKSLKSSTG